MAKAKEQKRLSAGRPPLAIDTNQLAALGAMHATFEEIGAFFNCTKRTITNRLKDPELLLAYENGKLRGKLNLRRLQWRHAQGTGSSAVNMTIHMSKHWLGEVDKAATIATTVQTNNALAVNVEVSGARERITAKLSALSERIEGRVAELASESGASLIPREPVSGGN